MEHKRLQPITFYAFLTADAMMWTKHVSPLSPAFVGRAEVYDKVLPSVGFSFREFMAEVKTHLPA